LLEKYVINEAKNIKSEERAVFSFCHYQTHACNTLTDAQLDEFGTMCRCARSQSVAPKQKVLRKATALTSGTARRRELADVD
jgi:hypothetical protein